MEGGVESQPGRGRLDVRTDGEGTRAVVRPFHQVVEFFERVYPECVSMSGCLQ